MQANTERATQRQHTLDIPATLIHPLGPTVVELEVARQPATDEPVTTASQRHAQNSHIAKTWSLTQSQLDMILMFAWESLSPDTEDIISNLELVPSITASKLPYKDKLGMSLSV